ncbi:2-amino-4-hydroxy-6-hydroxymethyldihydropteridine diphosphokinase [Cryomorpha ignava]|uniref:2-amino-4-hydroxy-6-hydroxymethyldihydropteridine pyrophosphokinase n=1 Tax=Cryomorpha ignava TaxID=101383 RepID=A0A7K3WQR9_9FLAO|nr:2-amino-4-hydroxy-6-hydroxymethyldihydropteridine diphosphokinase [Cryomorpha ignava]NEN24019.1 2-amino-4-hydroxy-6-hydroxymethyldihydropteridine diphosphokinase [Cryomorpha ignava]
MAKAHDVYLSLGSNIGNRAEFLRFAIQELERSLSLVSVSPVYETEPWGYNDSKPYLNMAAWFRTDFSAQDLRKLTFEIEKAAGREERIKQSMNDYQARTLDIDILFYDQIRILENDLEIPHPRLHLRNFVLEPLAEINENLVHPVFDKTIKELLKTSPDSSEIKRFAEEL